MVRNWTVKTKQIKKKKKTKTGKIIKSSATKYGGYLLNPNASSHSQTEIVDLNNARERVMTINREIDRRKLHRQAEGLRGGGFNSEATSFVLSLPKDVYQPTDKEWRKIAENAVKDVAKANDLSARDLWQQSAVVLHREKSDKKNTHLNIMIGNIHKNEYVKGITQFKSTHAVKQSFNKSMLNLGVDHKKYTPKNSKTGNKPLFVARNDNLKDLENEISFAEIEQNSLKRKFAEIFEKLGNKLRGYIKATIEKDEELAKEQAVEIANDIDKIEPAEARFEAEKTAIETDEALGKETLKTEVNERKRRRRRR